ncbi:hypothetical protein FYJ43_04500 [Cutibacterium sp. WCA-380-WT-3A]|uniref:Uncharacterized protein n=1 Tax=Cutibacterium porci TaxID=2605781 RepID=A0A7K0J6C8_9ACTN|nr:hypothetical protein [Cutibacterium porci]MSS45318.1 hypothetical protein [Cutibacterium porci]
MTGARKAVRLDPAQASRALEESIEWERGGCATTTRRQIWVHTIDGDAMYIHVPRVAYAAAHDWTSAPGKLTRTCGRPQCVAPSHLEIIAPKAADRPPADLDRIAYLRRRGWGWRRISKDTGWSAADVAAIPHVRRIHEPLKKDAAEYIERIQ